MANDVAPNADVQVSVVLGLGFLWKSPGVGYLAHTVIRFSAVEEPSTLIPTVAVLVRMLPTGIKVPFPDPCIIQSL